MVHFLPIVFVVILGMAVPASAQPINRDILAMYNGAEDRAIETTRIHQALETPLNHLGYVLDYRELSSGLPAHQTLTSYAAVISWIEADTTVDAQYFAQANAAIDAGVKWIIFGDIGISDIQRDHPAYRGFLERLGLFDTGEYVSVTYDATLTVHDEDMYGFEAALSPILPGFPVLSARDAALDVILSSTSPQTEAVAILAAVSANGGYVASSYGMNYFEALQRTMWMLDPFAFLARALDLPLWPIPDTTTLSGRRLYFSHIDGDGWINGSGAQGYQGRGYVSAEVIMEEAIIAYPDLPVSVGLVAGDIVYDDRYRERAEQVARDLFALPQVEVASHTMTHPFLWRQLADYDRDDELADLARRTPPALNTWDRVLGYVGIDSTEPFTPPPGDPWRFYAETAFTIEEEVDGAIEVSNQLAPDGKVTELYLWSGDTSPDAAAIAATRQANVANMNGGDTRFDGVYPSVTYVAPLSRPVGAERQIYAVNSNENTYTNLWRGPHYGQLLLEETWARTGEPRRLRPQNLYYHMYAGERSDSLAALVHHLELARNQDVHPITASHYTELVEGFFSTRITVLNDRTWRIEDRGSLQTLRLESALGQIPDYDRSTGVIGHIRSQGALYVTLDPAVQTPVLALRAAEMPDGFALSHARWRVSDLEYNGCGLTAQIEGFGRPDMTWWAPLGRYEVVLSDQTGVVWSGHADAEAGQISVTPDLLSYAPLSLGITCLDGEAHP